MIVPSARSLLVAILLAALSFAPGCGDGDADRDLGVAVDTYTVRGIVVSLPDQQNPASDLMVHHEAIPEFRGQNGTRGMNEMTMPFPVGEGLDLSGVQAGQKVRLTFTVDYDEKGQRLLTYRATAVEPLPEGTELDLESETE